MNRVIKAKWVLLFFVVFSVPIIIIFIQQINNKKDFEVEIEIKNNRIRELEEEVEKLKDLNEELETSLKRSIVLQQRSNLFEEENRNKGLDNANASVVFRKSGCSYFILQNNMGYIVAEWFGGTDPGIGEVLIGKFDSFGFVDCITANKLDCRLWIDDYMLSKETALEKIDEHCD